jgi:c(7)-type cytochrome triheme protein
MPTLALLVLLAGGAGTPATPPGADARDAPRESHGRVVLDRSCTKRGIPVVTFEHWSHRARYTCRVCHVDAGFALEAGATPVSFDTNEERAHCGACHDGRTTHAGKPIFAACSGWPLPDAARGCPRCHAGPVAGPTPGYEAFRRRMPLDDAGAVDWVEAARLSLVTPQGSLDGRPPARASMRLDRDVEIKPVGSWMSKVTFSHRKHGAWNGCELCHPEIFPSTRRGAVRFKMADLDAGRFCGVCHGTVAFGLSACRQCHPEERRMR